MQVVRWPVKSERIFIQSGYRVKVYTLTRFCRLYGFHAFPEDKKSWIGSLWGEKALFFIGAAGIAVRMIAPHVKDKFTDSPVLMMDEKGSYVIPLLSGHVGGAVELAKEIAEKINAQAVLTTATDVEQKFADRCICKKQWSGTDRPEKAKEISAVVLDGNKIGLYSVFPIEGKFPEELKLCETEEFLRTIHMESGLQEEVVKGGKKRRFWIFRRRTWCWESDVAKGFPKKKSKARSMRQKKILGFTEKEVIEIDSIDLKKRRGGDYFLMRQSGSFHFTRFQQKSWERLNVSAPIRSLSGRSRVWTMYVSGRRSLQPERMAGF